MSVSPSYATRWLARRRVSIRSPNQAGEVDHEPELCLLRLKGDPVPGFDAGKAALRADAEAIEIDEAAGVGDAAAELVDVLHRGSLGRYQAEHNGLVFRHETQRREIASARTVVFEEEKPDVEPVEQPFGDRIVAALGVPAPAAIAAAQMHADGEVGKPARHPVGHVDIAINQAVPIVATGRERGPDPGIAEFGERGLVDLDIAAACHRQCSEFAPEGIDNVAPECIDIIVGARRHRGVAAAEMQRTWARNGDLRHGSSHRLQAHEVVHVNWTTPCDPAADPRRRLQAAPLAAASFDRRHCVDGNVAQLAVEIAVIGGAAEFPIADDRESGRLLQPDSAQDRFVFDGGKLVTADLAGAKATARCDQALGPQQTADVLGPERWRNWCPYLASHCGTRLSESARAAALVPVWMRPEPSAETA